MGIIQQDVDGEWIDCIAFMISIHKWGKGYASEGTIGCVKYAFDVLKRQKIYATVEKENQASKKVLEKLGMKYEREAVCFNKKVDLYSMENLRIIKTSYDQIEPYRIEYFHSLPEFQELYIELMVKDSGYFLLQSESKNIGYAIINKEDVLIEFYVEDKYVNKCSALLKLLLKELTVAEIYCKTFDALLYNQCIENGFEYTVIGILFREYIEAKIPEDKSIRMVRGTLSSKEILLKQDDSLKELYETEELLVEFLEKEYVFIFYKEDEIIGCGMVIKTKMGWNYCDLGVWVASNKRGDSIGAQILIKLRAFALDNNLIPSCGCAIENIASQKTIEKSGYVSKHQLVSFKTNVSYCR